MEQRIVHVYLTEHQCRYLAGLDAEGKRANEASDTVITMVDDEGGIFVEQAATAGEEGSGIWVDALGNEHQGPGAEFARLSSEQEERLNTTRLYS